MTQNNKSPIILAPYVNIPLQEASFDIWDQKYRVRDADGAIIDQDLEASQYRTAVALASREKLRYRKRLVKLFFEAMQMGATPAGRILSNAGAEAYKRAVSLINCTVSDTIPDSMDGILMKNWEAGLTLKAGCGIGYEFSTLRPNGAYVSGAGASTSGPLSFMDIYDKTCFTVSSAGGRRGAQMATFDVTHPDVLAFIKAKREDGRFRQFNLSLLITDEFVEAVKTNAMWKFMWNGEQFYVKDEQGNKKPAEMPARELWDAIMDSNYYHAEPGFLLIDHINKYNNLWFTEHLRATNPCGEQPLPPYGSCLLGSLNLTKFIISPFTNKSRFDFDKYYEVARIFTRMLDNVVEISGLPLPQQRHEIEHKRRHGMGYLGLGSALAMQCDYYGSDTAISFTDSISRLLAFAGFEEGAALAKEKGEAPVLKAHYTREQISSHLKYNSNHGKKKYGASKKSGVYTGRELFLESHYFDAWRDHKDGRLILKMLAENGSRFSHHSSIAPTGTISLSIGNNASNGIEPTFAHAYPRSVIRQGKKAKDTIQVCSFEYLAYKTLVDPQAEPVRYVAEDGDLTVDEMNSLALAEHKLPAYFVATDDLTPKQHVDMQAAAQKWIDSSISKTVNVPQSISFEDFKGVYMYAYEKGLKGCTTYRPNPKGQVGVLLKEDDLRKSQYVFELDNGDSITAFGNEIIEYEGQTSTAANLYAAIKEGYYGKL
jgi:ribonucleoside-diphosphate reductase alpha chain